MDRYYQSLLLQLNMASSAEAYERFVASRMVDAPTPPPQQDEFFFREVSAADATGWYQYGHKVHSLDWARAMEKNRHALAVVLCTEPDRVNLELLPSSSNCEKDFWFEIANTLLEAGTIEWAQAQVDFGLDVSHGELPYPNKECAGPRAWRTLGPQYETGWYLLPPNRGK